MVLKGLVAAIVLFLGVICQALGRRRLAVVPMIGGEGIFKHLFTISKPACTKIEISCVCHGEANAHALAAGEGSLTRIVLRSGGRSG